MRLTFVGALLATVTVFPIVASGQAKVGGKAPEIDFSTLVAARQGSAAPNERRLVASQRMCRRHRATGCAARR